MLESAITLFISASSTPLMLYWSVRCWQVQFCPVVEFERILERDVERAQTLIRLFL